MAAAPEVAPSPRPQPLAFAQQIRRLTPEEAAQQRPVRIAAVVTHFNPHLGDLFVQDLSAGIYVHPQNLLAGLVPGDRVQIEGTTDPGSFSPCIQATSMTLLGKGLLPEPEPYDFDWDDARWLDGQYVQARVIVESVVQDGLVTRVSVYTDRGSGRVVIPGDAASAMKKLIGLSVRIRGALVAGFNADRTIGFGPTLYAQSVPPIRVAHPNEGSTMTRKMADLFGRFHPELEPGVRRVSVSGTVTANPSSEFFAIQDGTIGALIYPSSPTALAPGTRVEVTGILDIRGPRLVFTRADVKVIASGSEAPPLVEPVDLLVRGQRDGRLVEIVGILDELVIREGTTILTVRSGATWFEAHVPQHEAAGDWLVPKSKIKLVGVPSSLNFPRSTSTQFVLFLRTPADVTVVEVPPVPPVPPPPPWWTPKRIAAVVGGISAVGVLVAAWVVSLRLRVRRQTVQIRQQLESEAQLDARYKNLFDIAGDAVWVTDRTGQIAALNRAGEKLLGVTREQALGHTITEFVDPTDSQMVRGSRVAVALAPFELTLRPATGAPVIAELTSRVLPDGGVQTIARNVTERRKLQDQMERVRRLDAIGRLAGGIAHDFNNLLTVINGSAELLQGLLPPGDARELAESVLGAGERAAGLTRQLLTFSRQRFATPSAVDLAAAVTGLLPILKRLIGDHVQIATTLPADRPPVTADTGLIEQIVMNLAMNASDASPSGGTIVLETETLADGWGRLSVIDTGSGMDDATQARLFEPFFTTKPVGQGTGLGLATVYGIVQGLGGRITFTSTLGRGTAFFVDFPPVMVDPPMPETHANEPTSPNAARHRGTVLLVEDDDAVRLLASQVLRIAGFDVLSAGSGLEALEQYEHRGHSIDLLVTDVLMPGMTGTQLAERLKLVRPGLRVLYVSGYPGDELSRQGLAEEGIELLRKPFTPSELNARVAELLRRDRLEPLR